MARDLSGFDWPFGLLDRLVDAPHRTSRRVPYPESGDEVTELGVIRTRTPRRAWRLDPCWRDRFICKLWHFFLSYVRYVLTSSCFVG